ncbi:MAG: hypothetical protein P8N05_01840 [Polaribacter sp.]|nr:hypothetical protein [Polaribacter sp.]MDG1452221.1 hypothetical protein [Polaribacter sp.]
MTISLHHSILLDITINFLVGISSSLVFVLVILRLFKPKIKISDKICYKNDENGNKFYFFKIVNNSIYNTYSIKIELYKKTPYIVNKTKINYRIQEIKISSNNYYFIPRYKKQKGYGDHAVLSRTFEDLSKEIDKENVEYVLYVSAKHGLSNLTSVTTMSFESSKVFHKGNFKFGSNIRTL